VTRPSDRREASIDAIRDRFAEYETTGRARRWNVRTGGIGLAIAERDSWLVGIAAARRPRSVLDIGCGDGNVAVTLDAAGLRPDVYLGIDLIDTRIGIARSRAPWATFRVASASSIPLPDASVDMIVAFTVLSSVRDDSLRRAIAREVDRTLTSDGAVLVYDLRLPSPGNRSIIPIPRRSLDRLFPGWRIHSRSLTLLPPLARTPLAAGPRRYRALTRLPILRSHLASVITRP
jgi:SAM-dependent methyltransferase